jgi:hypothetical protein
MTIRSYELIVLLFIFCFVFVVWLLSAGIRPMISVATAVTAMVAWFLAVR